MRRCILPVLALVCVSSCIEVTDFGAYWAKGALDPALAGTWKKLAGPGQTLDNTPGVDMLVFAKDGPVYALHQINPIRPEFSADVAAQQRKDNDDEWSVKTLKIGSHPFVLARHTSGERAEALQRYDIRGNILREYAIDHQAAIAFLEAKHPGARNIVSEHSSVVIHTFDDEVFRILSEIADVPKYWTLVCRYRKAS